MACKEMEVDGIFLQQPTEKAKHPLQSLK